jgi:hypothetical protein
MRAHRRHAGSCGFGGWALARGGSSVARRTAALASWLILCAPAAIAAPETCVLDDTAGGAQAAGRAGTWPASVTVMVEGPWTLAWATRPSPLPVGRHVELDLRICGAPVDSLRVDADMPAHRHGMNYAAQVKALGGGRFLAQGLLFHMPGTWRLIFDIESEGRVQRLTYSVDLP